VVRICNKGVLNTLSNQVNYHRLGRVIDSPPPNTKCNMPIMRACRKDVIGSKVKGKKWNKFGKSEANSQKTREQKTLLQLMSKQQPHTTIENWATNASKTSREELSYLIAIPSCQSLHSQLSYSFIFLSFPFFSLSFSLLPSFSSSLFLFFERRKACELHGKHKLESRIPPKQATINVPKVN